MIDDLSFRLAHPADIDAIVARAQSAYRGESGRLGWTSEAHLLDGQRTDAAAVAELLAKPNSLILLMEEGDHLVGCCHLEVTADGGWLGRLGVQPARLAAGGGRRLIAVAEALTRDRFNATHMNLQVIEGRAELIAWYERLGYRRTGGTAPFPDDERFGIVRGEPLHFVVMRKALAALSGPGPGASFETPLRGSSG